MKMMKMFLIIAGAGCSIGLLLLTVLKSTEVTTAQQPDDIEQQARRSERDRAVPKAKVEKAFAEAAKINDAILTAIAARKPGLKLKRQSASHLIRDVPGSRGDTSNEMSWRKGNTFLEMSLILHFDNSKAVADHRFGLQGISMGEFFRTKEIPGEDAVIVKNVQFNTESTAVGLHFVKGRAQVSIYLTNHGRKTVQNEKELLEIGRIIEPLIVARPKFDDP